MSNVQGYKTTIAKSFFLIQYKGLLLSKAIPMKTRLFITLLAISAIIFSCHRVKEAVTDKADPNYNYAANGYVKGFITDVQLDGCKWMIQLDSSGKRIEPDEVAPAFQKDSLLVWVKYSPEDRMSICMAGQTVKLIDIRKR